MLTVDFSLLPLSPGWRVLDAGCGDGRHLAAVAERGVAGVLGLDRDPANLANARQRLQLHQRLLGRPLAPVGLAAGDLTSLPLADCSVDLLIASEVMEHVADQRRAVREMARVLKPNGYLVVSVPRAWPERLCWLFSAEYAGTAGGHLRVYDRRELGLLLASAGFRLWAAAHAHALHAPFWWLKCLAGLNDANRLVAAYHRFLVWDMMKKPRATRALERLLNPIAGKSLVLYLRKDDHA